MKVASISVNINTPDFNYGAVLHSWAFQQYVQRLPFIDSMEIIDYTTPYLEKKNRTFPWMSLLKEGKRKLAWKSFKKTPAYLKRLGKFYRFEKKHLICSRPYTQKELAEASLPYDAIVCESDIIWNPKLCKGHYDPAFFAALPCFRKMNKIAYSPSIGDSIEGEEFERQFEKLLENLNFISCRESYAKPIIEKYTTKPVSQVLDPVMLLDSGDYQDITGKRIVDDDYLLLYLPVNDNPKLREQAKQHAQEKHLKILEISTKLRERDENHLTLTSAGIEEFLSSVKYASCIFTNSFHAICFAVIFEKEFYAFTRKYSGKVRDICKTMHLSERFLENDAFSEKPPIDFSKIRSRWFELREKSREWLRRALTSHVIQQG